MTKLTDNQVREIRKLYVTKEMSVSDIAIKFKTTPTNVRLIGKGLSRQSVK